MKNVILLTVDVLRRDALGCYGNESGLTPFIDSLQNKCLRFTRAQASGPYTQASFPGILTSSYYLEYGKPKGLSPQRTLVSESLKEAGIVTAAFHSNPYLSGFLGWNRGWDVFYDSMEEEVDPKIPYIKGDVMNSKVHKWLSSHTRGGKYRPFFLFSIPEEAIEVFLVVLHCPGAFIFSLLGENKALDQRFEGCSERCLDIGTDNHYSFWNPPCFCRFRWSRPDLATFGFLGGSGGLTTEFPIYGRGGRI